MNSQNKNYVYISGVCRPISTCNWAKEQLSSRKITLSQIVTCGFDANGPIICCQSKVKQPIKRKSEIACDLIKKLPKSDEQIPQNDGLPTRPGELPHLVALGYYNEMEQKYIYTCSGILISKKIVLTTAHCIDGPPFPTIVTMGKVTLEQNYKFPGENQKHIGIENTTMHPNYIYGQSYHDIGLIELSMPVTYSNSVRPACLFTGTNNQDPQDPRFLTLSAAGWGQHLRKGRNLTMLLKSAMELVDQKDCDIDFNLLSVPEVPDGVKSSQICAFMDSQGPAGTIDPCEMDNGGPIQTVIDGEHFVIGVSSFKPLCGRLLPGIYNEVMGGHLDWIESVAWSDEVEV